MELSWGFAGQILVTIILGLAVGVAIVTGLIWLYVRYLDHQDAQAGLDPHPESFEILPRGLTPLHVDVDDDDEFEDYEHMRVVREATQP